MRFEVRGNNFRWLAILCRRRRLLRWRRFFCLLAAFIFTVQNCIAFSATASSAVVAAAAAMQVCACVCVCALGCGVRSAFSSRQMWAKQSKRTNATFAALCVLLHFYALHSRALLCIAVSVTASGEHTHINTYTHTRSSWRSFALHSLLIAATTVGSVWAAHFRTKAHTHTDTDARTHALAQRATLTNAHIRIRSRTREQSRAVCCGQCGFRGFRPLSQLPVARAWQWH